MSIKNLLYLLQLEEYDLKRFSDWILKNPGKEVLEKKGRLVWTGKAKTICFLARVLSFAVGSEKALIISVKMFSPADLLVKTALVLLAKIKLLLFHRGLTVIGITGSWGKTTQKEKIYDLLKTKYSVAKTQGNNNTLLGVAKNILKIKKGTRFFVVEMGAYRAGEIKSICDLVKPRIGIITVVGSMHLERFGSLENIKKAKLELFYSLPKEGLAVLPENLIKEADAKKIVRNTHFFKNMDEIGYIVGKELGFSKEEVASIQTSVPHRRELIEKGSIKIIDDSYNSNPAGFEKALLDIGKVQSGKKILVTPGMIELGELQYQENFLAGQKSGKVCDIVIVVGETNKEALVRGVQSAKSKTKVLWAKDLEEAKSLLSENASPNSTVLLENDLPDHYF